MPGLRYLIFRFISGNPKNNHYLCNIRFQKTNNMRLLVPKVVLVIKRVVVEYSGLVILRS